MLKKILFFAFICHAFSKGVIRKINSKGGRKLKQNLKEISLHKNNLDKGGQYDEDNILKGLVEAYEKTKKDGKANENLQPLHVLDGINNKNKESMGKFKISMENQIRKLKCDLQAIFYGVQQMQMAARCYVFWELSILCFLVAYIFVRTCRARRYNPEYAEINEKLAEMSP